MSDVRAEREIEDPREHRLPCGIVTADRLGMVTYANRWVLDRWTHDPVGRPFAELLTRSDRAYLDAHLRPLLHEGGEAAGVSLRMATRPEPIPVFVSARRDADWNVDYVLYPAGERIDFERELVAKRREAEELASLLVASPDPIYSVDAQMCFTGWNPTAERLFGYSQEEAIGSPLPEILAGDMAQKQGVFQELAARTGPLVFETEHLAKDGTVVPVECNAVAQRDEAGNLVGAVCVARDVRMRRRTQAQLEALAEEVAHRSKNMLSVVQVIASQTRRHSRPEDFIESFAQRLNSLVSNNALLVRSRFEPVAMRDLVASQLHHLDFEDRFGISGPEIAVRAKAAEAIAMALFELATNAAKYGALSSPDGRVSLDWWIERDDLVVRWRERGGPPVVAPTREGFGSAVTGRIVESATEGQVERRYTPDGLDWRLVAPTAKVLSA